MPTKSRRRADAKRSRQDVESDKHISQEKKDFFEMVGGATGLRKSELQSIKGSALETERDVDGFYYFRVQGKGGSGVEVHLSLVPRKKNVLSFLFSVKTRISTSLTTE